MRRRAKAALGLAVLGSGLAAFLLYPRSARHASPTAQRAPAPAPSASAPTTESENPAECPARALTLPNGMPAILSCGAARRVIEQVRNKLAAPASAPSPNAFADATSDWLDPHGLWSVSPDSPVKHALRRRAQALLNELTLPASDPTGCDAAREIAEITRQWVGDVRRDFLNAKTDAHRPSADKAFLLATDAVFQDDPVTRPARELARDLGSRVGAFERVYGDAGQSVSAASARLLPDLGLEQWTGIVLTAAVRAYVPAVDPHGQWAPLDEEWSLYTADPALDSEPRLWGRMMRTALGVKIQEDPAAPLIVGDLVLSIGGVPTAGLSVEQIDQLSHLEPVAGESAREVVVLRRRETGVRKIEINLDENADEASGDLGTRQVAFADGEILVVNVPDVPDDLGDQMEQIVSGFGDSDAPLGILLDLRGNGGGSIDGAAGAIGVFLPGAPSFPLHRRNGEVEVEHAASPPHAGQWHGPVAALVDGYTASAAEMIAGAIATYRRGPVIGSRTFGKGCIQEYFDDRAGVGVLRLTTMLFALPDGSALQGVGITPSLFLPMPRVSERERVLLGSLPPWQGPDVRAKGEIGGPEWPAHKSHVGPCDEPQLCSALRRLGEAAKLRRSASNFATRPARRAGQ